MALSLRAALQCKGLPANGSVIHDLFGYPIQASQVLSLRRQLELLDGKHYDVNVIRVGAESFTFDDNRKICFALQFARDVFEQVNFGIGKTEWYQVSNAEAGSKAVIDSDSEASDLTGDWTVPNGALDLFVVRTMNDADGWSAVEGSCDKDSKGMTGSVVSLNGSDSNAGNTFAHEMGHYLGLDHVAAAGNFIGNNGSSNSNTAVTNAQGNEMKKHCFVSSGC